MRMLVALCLVCVAFAGCLAENNADGQTASSKGSLSYNGASAGKQTSPPRDCDDDGKVNVSWNLGGGSVTFRVKDGAGLTIWSKEASGPGQGTARDDVSGMAGDWVLEATREAGSMFTGGGWSGQYAGAIEC